MHNPCIFAVATSKKSGAVGGQVMWSSPVHVEIKNVVSINLPDINCIFRTKVGAIFYNPVYTFDYKNHWAICILKDQNSGENWQTVPKRLVYQSSQLNKAKLF